jgi:NAD(P)-dependent dehydrogenase (short-subunit alcohol dehydrogenase family)
MSRRFDGRIAVVTGAASGIGAATAQALTAEGATVVGLDIQAPAKPGGPFEILSADVSAASDVAAAADAVASRHGRCDVLVNCAGVADVGPAGECTEQQWDRLFDVNARGTWLVCRAFLALMPHGGAIVNVSSGAALRPMPGLAAYAASKAAVVALTRSIALDYADRGIRANCLCPGVIDTPLANTTQQLRPAGDREAVADYRDYLIKRAGRPEEVAESILLLCSPQLGYLTGSTLAVDGGRTLH